MTQNNRLITNLTTGFLLSYLKQSYIEFFVLIFVFIFYYHDHRTAKY